MQNIIKEDINIICDKKLDWTQLKEKRILVTGANGFIPSQIIYTLLELNIKYNLNIIVYALCRNKEKAYKRFGDYLDNKYLVFIFQDVSSDISDDYRSDIIIHAASPANYYDIGKEPYSVIEANVIAYDKLLKKSVEWRSSDIILFSSSAVYGSSSSIDGFAESDRNVLDFTDKKDVYGLSKQMCEMMTVCHTMKHNVRTKVIRPFVVYGPGDALTSKKAVIDFLNDGLSKRNILLKSDGTAIRSYVYIRDAVLAFFYIMLANNSDTYNIANEENVYSIREIAEQISDCFGDVMVEHIYDNAEYLKNKTSIMSGKCDKLHKLGWYAEVSIKEGFERTIEWGKAELLSSEKSRG